MVVNAEDTALRWLHCGGSLQPKFNKTENVLAENPRGRFDDALHYKRLPLQIPSELLTGCPACGLHQNRRRNRTGLTCICVGRRWLLKYPFFNSAYLFIFEVIMSVQTATSFEHFLNQQTDEAWERTIQMLLPAIHEVDKTATQIWFRFYPLALLQALQQSADPEKLAAQLLLQGNYYLKDQIDSSHAFFYGHRFWPEVKKVVTERAASLADAQAGLDLAGEIREMASRAASQVKADASLLIGITAVALMTLQQTGMEAFQASSGAVKLKPKAARLSPEQVLKERARDDSQGLFGFLKTVDKEWTVTYDEQDERGSYRMKHLTDLAYGAALDQSRDWRAIDPRCIEGPIPVECRSASCGTCWVGVLGGAEKLSDVARLEGKRIKEFGYINTDEPKPLIRLACQAQASGAISIVIPPWNGVFGKYLNSLKVEESHDGAKAQAEEV
jgi:ferredoxin